MRAVFRVFGLLALSLILIACGGGGGSGGDDDVSLSLDTRELSFSAARNGPTPDGHTVTVSYVGDGVLVGYPPEEGEPSWLALEVVGDQFANPLQVRVTPAHTSLAAGRYSATVRFVTGSEVSEEVIYKDLAVTYDVDDRLSLGSDQLSFETVFGTADNPAAQSVSVSGEGIAWTAGASETWVMLDASAGTGPTSLGVSVDADGLGIGEHSAVVTVTDTADGSSETLSIAFSIAAPAIAMVTEVLDFSGVNGKAIAQQSVDVAINSGAVVNWTATSSASWLLLNDNAGSAGGVTPDTLLLDIDAQSADLASGVYATTVTLTADVGGQTLTTMFDVNLELTPMTFATSPDAVSVSGINGADLGTQVAAFALDTDAYDHPWSVTSAVDWLLIDGGATADGVNSGSLNIGIDATALVSGDYQTTVTVTATVNGDTITTDFPVSLSLTPATLSFDMPDVTFDGVNGNDLGTAPVGFSLDTGAVSHAWSVTLTSDNGVGGVWLLGDGASGVVSETAASVTLSVDTVSMLGEVYTGTMTVTANVHGDVIVDSVPVTLNLEPHMLFIADNGVALSSFPTQTSVLSHVVTVSENGALPTAWTAASDQSWLTVTASGTTDDDMTLTADPASLAVDTVHYASVTVTSTDPTIENEQTVRVGFWVGGSDPNVSDTVLLDYSHIIADPVRPYVYVHNGGTGIDVYNIYTAALERTIAAVSSQLDDMVVGSDGATLFASDFTNYGVVPVDLGDDTVGADWPLSTTVSYFRMAYARPNGFPVVLTSDGRAYGAADGVLLDGAFLSGGNIATPLTGDAIYVQRLGTSGHTFNAYVLEHSALNGGVLSVEEAVSVSESGFANDLAANIDGSRVYSATGSPYNFRVYDSTLTEIQTLPADAFPNNAELSAQGLFYGGINGLYGPTDVWVYDADGFERATYYISGFAAGLRPRQLVVSGDGTRLITLTDDPKLTFITVSP